MGIHRALAKVYARKRILRSTVPFRARACRCPSGGRVGLASYVIVWWCRGVLMCIYIVSLLKRKVNPHLVSHLDLANLPCHMAIATLVELEARGCGSAAR